MGIVIKLPRKAWNDWDVDQVFWNNQRLPKFNKSHHHFLGVDDAQIDHYWFSRPNDSFIQSPQRRSLSSILPPSIISPSPLGFIFNRSSQLGLYDTEHTWAHCQFLFHTSGVHQLIKGWCHGIYGSADSRWIKVQMDERGSWAETVIELHPCWLSWSVWIKALLLPVSRSHELISIKTVSYFMTESSLSS